MKFLVAFACVLLASSALAAGKKKDDKVKIAVYYEALCPDSKSFIVSQLAPVWRELRGAIKVKLVPYGKATHTKVGEFWQFTCQHGPDECLGNKMQSCILKDRKIADTDKVDFVVCLMSQPNPDKALDTCATQTKQSGQLEKLQKCTSGDQGSSLLAQNGVKTDAIAKPLSFVPTIVFNEVFNQALQDEAVTNLKAVVCRLSVKKPAACS